MSIQKSQVQNFMRNPGSDAGKLSHYTSVYNQMVALEDKVRNTADPSFSDMNTWRRMKFAIENSMKVKI